jgi:DNA protecting protein DprA
VVASEFDIQFLALAQLRGVGLHALRALVLAYGELGDVWDDDPTRIAEVLTTARVPSAAHIADVIKIEGRHVLAKGKRERERLAQQGYRVIGAQDPAFPHRLRELPNQPLWLFLEGNPAALNSPPLVAIVGTREASQEGIDTARHLAWLVLQAGLGIVSGLAEGVDREAHEVAARHCARQVAVLGTGIEIMFPASHADLRRRIVENGGVVVTEYLPRERYGKANFVQRNRIQAALASAVCPIEAKTQSGTAHTIRFARDYDRPLFGARRGQPNPANNVLTELAATGAPVFDLALGQGRQELRAFLDQIEGERALPPPPIDQEFWVRGVLNRLRQMQSYYDLTSEEKRRIVEQVASVLELTQQQAETGRDG